MSNTAINLAGILSVIENSIPIIDTSTLPEDLTATAAKVFSQESKELDIERINILLHAWKRGPIDRGFLEYYFNGNIYTIEQLAQGTRRFVKDALWYFGDVRYAFDVLREMQSVADIEEYFANHAFDDNELRDRLPWDLIQEIAPTDRGLLGYVSGRKPFDDKALVPIVEAVLDELDQNRATYEGLTREDISGRVLDVVSTQHPDIRDRMDSISNLERLRGRDLWDAKALKENRAALKQQLQQIENTIERVHQLREVGEQNLRQYLLNIKSVDVYVATSMRSNDEYIEMAQFVSHTFADEALQDLKLRYFDPTLCYCNSRLDKGIIECLLVRSAKVTIYCAQNDDTFGKDSELAATLCQGKPVIVYVPTGSEKLENRARTFKEFHPLGLQVGLHDGVARGVIVVRSPAECAKVLSRLLTNTLETDLRFEEHGIVLREHDTGSVLRVVTGWPLLAHVFWHNFKHEAAGVSGRAH